MKKIFLFILIILSTFILTYFYTIKNIKITSIKNNTITLEILGQEHNYIFKK